MAGRVEVERDKCPVSGAHYFGRSLVDIVLTNSRAQCAVRCRLFDGPSNSRSVQRESWNGRCPNRGEVGDDKAVRRSITLNPSPFMPVSGARFTTAILWRWRAVATLLLATESALAQSVGVRTVVLPVPSGPFAVGYRRDEVADPARMLTRGSSRGMRRRLVLHFWYPSGDARGARTMPYMNDTLASTWAASHGLPGNFQHGIRTHVVPDAPLADSGGAWPVLLFSHGRSWPVQTYQIMLTDLASRGWLVVAISHPGEEALTSYADGSAVLFDQEAWSDAAGEARVLGREIDEVVTDAEFALTHLGRWNGSKASPWYGRIDLRRVGYFGHSLGGSAAAVALTRVSGVKAAAALEGVVHDSSLRRLLVNRPLLTMIGGYNDAELSWRDYRPGPDGVVFEASVRGAWHASFADLLLVYRAYAARGWLARHRRELDPARVNQIVTDYLDAFFRRYLFGTPALLLRPYSSAERGDYETSGYPEVLLRVSVP